MWTVIYHCRNVQNFMSCIMFTLQSLFLYTLSQWWVFLQYLHFVPFAGHCLYCVRFRTFHMNVCQYCHFYSDVVVGDYFAEVADVYLHYGSVFFCGHWFWGFLRRGSFSFVAVKVHCPISIDLARFKSDPLSSMRSSTFECLTPFIISSVRITSELA